MSIVGAATFTNNEAWTEQAECAKDGPDDSLWYPDRWGHSAKVICRRCPVKEACLEYALKRGERYGIWGGLNTKERDELRRERRGGSRGKGNHKPTCGCPLCNGGTA